MMRHLSIKATLILGFMFIAAIIAVVGTAGYMATSGVNALSEEIIFNHALPMFDIIAFIDGFQQNRVMFRDILLRSEQEDMQRIANAMDAVKNEQQRALDDFIAETGEKDPESVKIAESMGHSIKLYEDARRKIIAVSLEGRTEESIDMLYEPEFAAIAQSVQDEIDSFETQKAMVINALNDRQDEIEQSTLVLFVVVAAFGIGCSVAFGIAISFGISGQIKMILGSVKDVADGDLTARIATDRRNELGELSNEVDRMADDLCYVISSVQDTAVLVDDASKQVSSSSMSLAQISTEQASSAQEISASITEIAAQTKTNADNASKATELADMTRQEAQKGREQMGEMLGAMSAINDASVSISNIIKVIEDIAFQTNILALNAAVEAARAGQHGKGFAVVAEEVRTLAARSARAASETTGLIESAAREVANGSKIAGKTAESLNSVVDEIARSAELAAGISSASIEQSQSIGQVNIGVDQVSQAIQTTSSVAQETASASSELSEHASTLKALVSGFKIGDEPAGAGGAGATGKSGSNASGKSGARAAHAGPGSGSGSGSGSGPSARGGGKGRLPGGSGGPAGAAPGGRQGRAVPDIDLGPATGFG
jgi:methyl-accepting chemotaxis protein